jgi:hypothetical protein
MAALFLLLLAVTGGVLIAELVVENPTADQITLFHHTSPATRRAGCWRSRLDSARSSPCCWLPP